jgi:hypothetical protein
MPCSDRHEKNRIKSKVLIPRSDPFFVWCLSCFMNDCRRSCLSYASDISLPKTKERMAVAATLMGGQTNTVQATGATIMPTGLFAHVARLVFEPKESNIEFRIKDQVPIFLSKFPPANFTLSRTSSKFQFADSQSKSCLLLPTPTFQKDITAYQIDYTSDEEHEVKGSNSGSSERIYHELRCENCFLIPAVADISLLPSLRKSGFC